MVSPHLLPGTMECFHPLCIPCASSVHPLCIPCASHVHSCASPVHPCAFLCIPSASLCIPVHPCPSPVHPCASPVHHLCIPVHPCAFLCIPCASLCIPAYPCIPEGRAGPGCSSTHTPGEVPTQVSMWSLSAPELSRASAVPAPRPSPGCVTRPAEPGLCPAGLGRSQAWGGVDL